MHMQTLRLQIAAVAVFLLIPAFTAAAQDKLVEIRAGHVVVDGEILPPEAAPRGLDLTDVQLRIELSDHVPVFIMIDGRLLQVNEDGLHDVEDYSVRNASEVFLGDGDPEPHPSSVLVRRQANVLRSRAEELQRLTLQLQDLQVQSPVMYEMIENLLQSASETEEMARRLPHMYQQRYLEEVREHNEELYDRLMREQALESNSIVLSQRIREMEEGPERSALVDSLRGHLNEIFAIKHENRRQEIADLEQRVERLQRGLEKRERYHNEIVERRLNHLIGAEE